MPVFWLPEDEVIFPDPELADPNGVLAVGGDLSPERLLTAYQMGIFPWFNPNEPMLWWSPDPRFVLFPEKLKVSRSMRPYFNQGKFQVSLDQDFEGLSPSARNSDEPDKVVARGLRRKCWKPIACCMIWATPIPWRFGMGTSWLEDCTAFHWERSFLVNRCLPKSVMPLNLALSAWCAGCGKEVTG